MMLAKGDTGGIGMNKQFVVRCGLVMVDGLARSPASHWRFGVGQSPQAAPQHFKLLTSSRSSPSISSFLLRMKTKTTKGLLRGNWYIQVAYELPPTDE